MDRGNDVNNGGWGGCGRGHSVEETTEADLAADAVDAEEKVSQAEVVTVEVNEEDMMKTKGSTLTLILPASKMILTETILHLMTTNDITNSRNNKEIQSCHFKTFIIRTDILTV